MKVEFVSFDVFNRIKKIIKQLVTDLKNELGLTQSIFAHVLGFSKNCRSVVRGDRINSKLIYADNCILYESLSLNK